MSQIDPDTVQTSVAGVVAMIVTALGGRAWWRIWSRDRTEVVKDREEKRLIETLAKERDAANDRAEKAVAERDALMRIHLDMSAQFGDMKYKLGQVETELQKVRTRLDEVLRRTPKGSDE